MEVKSRYEVISDLESKKRELIRERDGFKDRIKDTKKSIRESERELEDAKEDLADFVYPFYSLNNHDVQMIELRGENYPILGIIFGGLGAAGGAKIGSGFNRDRSKFMDFGDAGIGCLIGGSAGLLLGIIIGNNITEDEVVYEYAYPEEYDFTQLNIYSRYGGKEPDYLKEME